MPILAGLGALVGTLGRRSYGQCGYTATGTGHAGVRRGRRLRHVSGGSAGAWILEKDLATNRVGCETLRIGPGVAGHLLTQLRGAEEKLPGESVYLTGYTRFDQTLRIQFA